MNFVRHARTIVILMIGLFLAQISSVDVFATTPIEPSYAVQTPGDIQQSDCGFWGWLWGGFQCPASTPTPTPTPSAPVLGPFMPKGDPEVISLGPEDYTVPNCSGSITTLSRTPSLGIGTGHNVEWGVNGERGVGMTIGGGPVPAAVDLSGSIGVQVQQGVEQSRQAVESWDLAAAPGEIVTYTIEWREVWQNGSVEVTFPGTTVKIFEIEVSYRTGLQSDLIEPTPEDTVPCDEDSDSDNDPVDEDPTETPVPPTKTPVPTPTTPDPEEDVEAEPEPELGDGPILSRCVETLGEELEIIDSENPTKRYSLPENQEHDYGFRLGSNQSVRFVIQPDFVALLGIYDVATCTRLDRAQYISSNTEGSFDFISDEAGEFFIRVDSRFNDSGGLYTLGYIEDVLAVPQPETPVDILQETCPGQADEVPMIGPDQPEYLMTLYENESRDFGFVVDGDSSITFTGEPTESAGTVIRLFIFSVEDCNQVERSDYMPINQISTFEFFPRDDGLYFVRVEHRFNDSAGLVRLEFDSN